MNNCPGQDKRKVTPEPIICSSCGYEAEIFSDEIKVKCPKCRQVFYREVLPTCVDWCAFAKECIGEQAYGDYVINKSLLLKEKLLGELKGYFGPDIKRINHARKVLDYAEEILRQEGGNWQIVVPAAILHDVGIKIAEQKYGSNSGHLQEKEGPQVAQKILLKLGFKKKEIEEICQIIRYHHSPGKINSLDFNIILDADGLVNLNEIKERDKQEEIINHVFATKTAKEIARKVYL
ncbi:MAG: HD domain-containing protein [Candidatus Omnitrophota bacterium]|nr:HD domain-containing protein [Candidatus Omnitrophota bacterium]